MPFHRRQNLARTSIWHHLLLTSCLLISACSGKSVLPLPDSDAAASAWIHSLWQQGDTRQPPEWPDQLQQIYTRTQWQKLWQTAEGLPSQAARTLQYDLQPWLALESRPDLLPYHQLHERLLALQSEPALEQQQQLTRDLVITDLFLHYLNDKLKRHWMQPEQQRRDQGIVNAYERWDDWPDEVRQQNLPEVLASWLQILDTDNPASWLQQALATARPNSQYYQPWRQAFDQLQAAARLNPWPQLPQRTLRADDAGVAVYQLAQQLRYLGDLPVTRYWPEVLPDQHRQTVFFDAELEQALKRFQHRHQLTPNGRTDAATRQQLNTPPQERMRRLAHNLRRLHHLPDSLNDRHLMINLADQQLSFVEQGNVTLAMKVVVGRHGQRTPIMSQWLTSLVLNPVWNVPPRIARENILPNARNNPDWLATRNYQLVRGWQHPPQTVALDELPQQAFSPGNNLYRFIQTAGDHNELGRAKFRLSNQNAIYLHDTPHRWNFQRPQRALSSGCVRVEHADQLVQALLAADRYWTPERIQQVYDSDEERYIQVRPRVAVYLMYWTAWTDSEGQLQWRDDLYDLDSF